MMKVTIGGREIELEKPNELLENSTPDDIQKIMSLMPRMTQHHLVNWILEMNYKKTLLIWKKELKKTKKVLNFNKEDIKSIIEMWNMIFNEYLDYKYILDIGIVISGTKVHDFDIIKLYQNLKYLDSEKNELAYRLIDVKMYLCFSWSIMFVEYEEAFKIVGHNELHEITPEAVNWINGLIYRISLLSILTEKTFDLIEYVINGKVKDHKKGKWEKKLEVISKYIEITEEEKKQILDFKKSYRTAEFHKISAVRAMTSKEKWISIQGEEKIIYDILNRFYAKIIK